MSGCWIFLNYRNMVSNYFEQVIDINSLLLKACACTTDLLPNSMQTSLDIDA
jgi:hypothetical protein